MVSQPGQDRANSQLLSPVQAREDAADRRIGRRALAVVRVVAVIVAVALGTMPTLVLFGVVTSLAARVLAASFALLGGTALAAMIICRRPARQVDGLIHSGILPAGGLSMVTGGICFGLWLPDGPLVSMLLWGAAAILGFATVVLRYRWRAPKATPSASPSSHSSKSLSDVETNVFRSEHEWAAQRSPSLMATLQEGALGWPADWRRRSRLLFPFAAHSPDPRSFGAAWCLVLFPAVARDSTRARLLGIALPLASAAVSFVVVLTAYELTIGSAIVLLLAGFAIMLGPSYLGSFLLRRPYWQPQYAPLLLVAAAIGMPLAMFLDNVDGIPASSPAWHILGWLTAQAGFLLFGTAAVFTLWGLFVAWPLALYKGLYRRGYMEYVERLSRNDPVPADEAW